MAQSAPSAFAGAVGFPRLASRLILAVSACLALLACDAPTGPAVAGEPALQPTGPSMAAQLEAFELRKTIKTDPEVIDLGDIPANLTSTKEVKLYNKGDKPITFTRVTASCGCLSGEVETREIKPGDFATLKVSWAAAQHNAAKSTKTLYVMADRAPAPLQIPVSAAIVGGLNPGDDGAFKPAPTIPALTIEIEPKEVDLGFLRPEQVGKGTITMRNTGDQPVELLRVSSNCSCAVGKLSNSTVAPGETATVDVELTAGPNIGLLQREVQVWGKDNPTPIRVAVKANVSYDVSADPMFVNMLGERKGEIVLKSIDGKPFRVLSTNGEKPVLGGGDAGAPAGEHSVLWDFTAVDNANLPRWVIIATDHPTMPLLDLRVIHPSLFPAGAKPDPWTPSQDRMLLGRVHVGQSFEREITLVKLNKDVAVTVEGDSAVRAEILEKALSDKGLRLKLKLTPTESSIASSTGAGALIHGFLTVRSPEPEHQTRIEVFATPDAVQ
jgi:hypothetical protein